MGDRIAHRIFAGLQGEAMDYTARYVLSGVFAQLNLDVNLAWTVRHAVRQDLLRVLIEPPVATG